MIQGGSRITDTLFKPLGGDKYRIGEGVVNTRHFFVIMNNWTGEHHTFIETFIKNNESVKEVFESAFPFSF